MRTHYRLATRLALCVCAAGTMTASAQAMHAPQEQAVGHRRAATPRVRPLVVASTRFDWADACVGAGAAAAVAALAGGAVLIVRRARDQQPALQ